MKETRWSIGDCANTPQGKGQIAEFAPNIGYSKEQLQPHFKVMLDNGLIVWVPVSQCKQCETT